MKSFNIFLDYFYKKNQNSTSYANIIGFDSIADSMCQMSMGN
jgi:hypothetical protein